MPIRIVVLLSGLLFFQFRIQAQSKAAILTDSAVVLHQSGKVQDAIALYTQALKLDPNYALAYFNRGLALNELSSAEAAIKDFTKALQLKQDIHLAYFNRGLAYFSLEQYALAGADMTQYIRYQPEDAEAYLLRGHIRFELQQLADAKTDYIKYTLMQSADPAGWIGLGDVNLGLENTEQALEAYGKAIPLQPTETAARLQRARIYYDLGRYSEAIADYDQLVKNEKDTLEIAVLYFERGDSKQAASRFREAIDDYSLAVINNPLMSDAYFQRSVCYLLLKDYQSSLEDVNRYLKFNPDDKSEAIYNRGVLFYNLGHKQEACQDWKISEQGGYEAAKKMILDYCK